MVLLLASLSWGRTLDIDVVDHAYLNSDVTIEMGDEVRWFFTGPSTHSATAASDQAEFWDTGPQLPGVFSGHVFGTEGAFVYYSSPHGADLGDGRAEGMVGTIRVVPPATDSDGDGLSDVHEVWFGSDPLVGDTDGDGLADGDEVDVWGSSPVTADTDGDGLDDGLESELGTSPISSDTDGDELSDSDEITIHLTDPLLADTDLGGLDDGDEVDLMLDPLEAEDDDGPMRLFPADPLVLGVSNPFNVDNASPLQTVYLVAGSTPGEFPVPGCPDLLLPFSDPYVLDATLATPGGRATLESFLGLPLAGAEAFFVAVQPAVCRRSARELRLLE